MSCPASMIFFVISVQNVIMFELKKKTFSTVRPWNYVLMFCSILGFGSFCLN